MPFEHVSVLLPETLSYLQIRPEGIYVDGTVGGGGHAAGILEKLSDAGKLIGIDRDDAAIQATGERLAGDARVQLLRGNFSDIQTMLHAIGIHAVDGIVLDLGVSSHQLDTAERGFSYMADAPLDMRMDQRQGRTAKELVNESDEHALTRILRDYGEERFAAQIARGIIAARSRAAISTTGELVEIVRSSVPKKAQAAGGHPAKRTFQAIRIAVNDELTALEASLGQMIELLTDGGRLCVISFHSLEDRIVKNAFRKAENPCTCPPDFPVCVCGKLPQGKVMTKHPLLPGDTEKSANPRAKSAKLRVFERRFSKIQIGEK